MKERNKIKSVRQGALNDADRLELARLLVKAGYCVRIGKEKDGNTNVTVVEYWEDKQ
jgi:hypothetical protein